MGARLGASGPAQSQLESGTDGYALTGLVVDPTLLTLLTVRTARTAVLMLVTDGAQVGGAGRVSSRPVRVPSQPGLLASLVTLINVRAGDVLVISVIHDIVLRQHHGRHLELESQ